MVRLMCSLKEGIKNASHDEAEGRLRSRSHLWRANPPPELAPCRAPYGRRRVAGLRRAGPSATLDKMCAYEIVAACHDGSTATPIPQSARFPTSPQVSDLYTT